MKITFIKLTYRNFMSVGNKDAVIKFGKHGVISITGENGAGKSVFEDALSYVLYAKPYRKIKVNEVKNRHNKKAKTFLEVIFDRNGTKYKITRILKNSGSEVKIEEKKGRSWQAMELLSTQKLIQEEINKLVGIKYEMFKHIVAIASATSNNKPFLDMSASEKRLLIENMFNLEAISKMNKEVKLDKSNLKHKKDLAFKDIELWQNKVSMAQSKLDNMSNTIQNFEDNKTIFINSKQEEIKKIEDNIKSYKSIIDELLPKVTPEIISEHTNKVNKLKNEIIRLKGEIKVCNTLIQEANDNKILLNKSDTCPVCATPITKDHLSKELNRLSSIIDTNTKSKSDYEQLISDYNNEITDSNSVLDKVKNALNTITEVNNEIKTLTNTINKYKDDINIKKNEHLINIDLDVIKKELEDNKKGLNIAKTNLNDITYRIRIIETSEFLLSDKGIKTEFYNIVVPLFNKVVNDYLHKFNLNVAIVFDNQFNHTIQTVESKNVNYFSFSQGERSRLDISILLTFVKLSKIISNWNCNLLLMDEIFDQNLDTNGLQLMLEFIRDISEDDDLTVIVISHKLDNINFIFDREITVKKKGNYSVLDEIK